MYIYLKRPYYQFNFLLLFFICFCYSNGAISQESGTNNLYNQGYYTSSIHSLKKELNSTNHDRKRVEIYYRIANSYYGMSFVEDYKKYIDSAYQLAQQKKDFSYLDEVKYGIAMIRYYNFEIKPVKSLEIYSAIYPLFHKKDPRRASKLWVSLYQNYATIRRNYAFDYKLMNAYYDSAYVLMKKHKLLNTIHEVHYCKSRGNINLDRSYPDADPIFYSEAIRYYERGLSIIEKQGINNYPIKIGFHCLEGLSSYMRGELRASKVYFDKAYQDIEDSKDKEYLTNDLKSIYLNVYNWSTFPISVLYQKDKDISIIKEHLERLRGTLSAYQSFSSKNKDIDISVFMDIYAYSPFNSMVSCYYYLYEKTKNTAYIDSAFYYGEMNKTQWSPLNVSLKELKKEARKSIAKGNVIIQYGEFGFVHSNYLYAIVLSQKGSFFLNLGKLTDIKNNYFDFNKWDYKKYAGQSSTLYEAIFKPLEPFFHSSPNKIIVNKNPFFANVSLESLIVDSTYTSEQKPFLFFKYPISNQPSFRLYSENKNTRSLNKVCLIQPKYDKRNKAQIRFSGKMFKQFVLENEMKLVSFDNKKQDLILVAAHCYSQTHRVDNAFIDMGKNTLSIRDVCKMNFNSKLAILAFCDGGVGQQISAGSNFSLASSFLMSGVASCLYSIWKLDDKIGSEVIASFLKRMEKGEEKDVALRGAKKEYLENVTTEEGLNPIYWAGLNVIGNVAPIQIQNSDISLWKIGIAILLFLLLGYRIKKYLQ